jgi:hypothetical protein
MTTRDTETLAQLVHAVAGERGRGLTYEQLRKKSIDPETGYQPSSNLLNRIGLGQDVKINERLIRAVAAGLELPLPRVQAAAARQYLGWQVAVDPGVETDTDDDEVIRVATHGGVTPSDTRRVEEFVQRSRTEDTSDEE